VYIESIEIFYYIPDTSFSQSRTFKLTTSFIELFNIQHLPVYRYRWVWWWFWLNHGSWLLVRIPVPSKSRWKEPLNDRKMKILKAAEHGMLKHLNKKTFWVESSEHERFLKMKLTLVERTDHKNYCKLNKVQSNSVMTNGSGSIKFVRYNRGLL